LPHACCCVWHNAPHCLAAPNADEGIPDFWLTAMTNHDMLSEYVTERDAEVLTHLTDVRVVSLTGEHAGSFRLDFTFSQNPFFSNATLSKTFYMEDPDEIVPDRFEGCDIDWAPGKDTTVTLVKRRVADKKGGKKGGGAAVTSTKPCDSFFNFFKCGLRCLHACDTTAWAQRGHCTPPPPIEQESGAERGDPTPTPTPHIATATALLPPTLQPPHCSHQLCNHRTAPTNSATTALLPSLTQDACGARKP
jgi:Nucleosome assembly protein (NAP)